MKKYNMIYSALLIAIISFSCSENSTESDKPVPQNVKILYKYSFKNELNTFTQKLTKDLVLNGTITVDFRLTEAEQNNILDMANQTGFFSLPDSLLQTYTDSTAVKIMPDPGIQYLKIKYGGKEKEVYWYMINSFPQEYARLLKLTALINEIIESKKEYKELPPARGGYL